LCAQEAVSDPTGIAKGPSDIDGLATLSLEGRKSFMYSPGGLAAPCGAARSSRQTEARAM